MGKRQRHLGAILAGIGTDQNSRRDAGWPENRYRPARGAFAAE